MGRDKALLDWHGLTLLEHMMNLMRAAADPILVVGRDQLPDRLPGLGPLSGIATGLENSPTDANLFVAVDLPHLTEGFLKYLRSRLKNSTFPLLACKIGADYPLCLGIWRPMLPEILRYLMSGQRSVRHLIETATAEIIDEPEIISIGFDVKMFRNINTPEDYARP